MPAVKTEQTSKGIIKKPSAIISSNIISKPDDMIREKCHSQ